MIVGVTGHQDIPGIAAAPIAEQVVRVLRRCEDLTGVTSLAAGADQIFAEAVLGLGGRLHVVIPSEAYETAFADDNRRATYRDLLGKADVVETLPHARPSPAAFLDAGRRVVDLAQLLIAVWDGEEARGRGGTADVVRYARQRGFEVVVVWPAGLAR